MRWTLKGDQFNMTAPKNHYQVQSLSLRKTRNSVKKAYFPLNKNCETLWNLKLWKKFFHVSCGFIWLANENRISIVPHKYLFHKTTFFITQRTWSVHWSLLHTLTKQEIKQEFVIYVSFMQDDQTHCIMARCFHSTFLFFYFAVNIRNKSMYINS